MLRMVMVVAMNGVLETSRNGRYESLFDLLAAVLHGVSVGRLGGSRATKGVKMEVRLIVLILLMMRVIRRETADCIWTPHHLVNLCSLDLLADYLY